MIRSNKRLKLNENGEEADAEAEIVDSLCRALGVSFSKHFFEMLMPYLNIETNLLLRLVSKRWKNTFIDANQMYWRVKSSLVAPYMPLESAIRNCAVFTLNGITDAHLNSMERLFTSHAPEHVHLVRCIVTHLTGRPCVGAIRVVGSKNMRHPGARGDPFSFCIVFEGVRTCEIFFCKGQGILWRQGREQLRTIHITDLVGPYRQYILF